MPFTLSFPPTHTLLLPVQPGEKRLIIWSGFICMDHNGYKAHKDFYLESKLPEIRGCSKIKGIKVVRRPWLALEWGAQSDSIMLGKNGESLKSATSERSWHYLLLPQGGIIGVNGMKLSKEKFRMCMRKYFLIMRSFIILSQWKY